MELTALALGQAMPTEAVPATAEIAPEGFAWALESVQAGAPPGPPPPTTGSKVEEEVASLGLIAQPQNPDFLPAEPQKVDASDDKDAAKPGESGEELLHLQAELCASLVATPLFTATPLPTGPAGNGLTQVKGVVTVLPTAPPPPTVDAEAQVDLDLAPAAIPIPKPKPSGSTPAIDAAKFERRVSGGEPVEADLAAVSADIQVTAPSPTDSATRPDRKTVRIDGVVIQPPPIPEKDKSEKRGVRIDGVVIEPQPIIRGEKNEGRISSSGNSAKTDDAFLTGQPADDAKARAPKLTSRDPIVSQRIGTPIVKTGDPSASDEDHGEMPFGAQTGDHPEIEKAAVKGKADSEIPLGALGRSRPEPEISTRGASSDRHESLRPRGLNLVVRQITDRLELLAATRPKEGVIVHLEPERLGSIKLTVRSLGGAVEAEIQASNDNVRSALETNQKLLSQSLQERGLKLDSVTVSQQPQSSTTMQGQARHSGQQHLPTPQPAPTGSGFPTSPAIAIDPGLVRKAVQSTAGVDLWT